jgi:hypothetical protein
MLMVMQMDIFQLTFILQTLCETLIFTPVEGFVESIL